MSADIIDYKDYKFVKDRFTGLYDIVLGGKLIDSQVSLNSAYHVAEDDWNSRYPMDRAEYRDSGFDSYRVKHTFEITDSKGSVVTEIVLDTQDAEVNRRKFRKATEAEINDPRIQKYVVEKYIAHTNKQNTDIAIIKDIANKFGLK